MQIPAEIRKVIEDYAAGLPAGRLARAAESMSDHYRARRNTASLPLSSEERVAAYLAIRFPATFAAAARVFQEIRGRLVEAPVSSLLDLGAGPGAASIAARSVFPALRGCALIESAAEFASVARRLLPPQAAISLRNLRNMESFPPHDLVVASYSLGELDVASRKHVLERAWAAAGVALVIIEPGSPAGFKMIREARAWLLEDGARMLAPCPGEAACPMPPDDWCHFAARVERTGLHRRLKGGALNYEDEKYSYIAVARQETVRPTARVIRRPEQGPGLIRLTVCRGDTLSSKQVTRRDPARFRAARHAEWGGEWDF